MSRIILCLSLLVLGMLLSFLGSAHISVAMVFQYDQDTALYMDFFPQVRHAIHHSCFLLCLSLTSQPQVYTPLKMNLMHQGARCNYRIFSVTCLATCLGVPTCASWDLLFSLCPPLACSCCPPPHTQGGLHSWFVGAQNAIW